MPDSIVTIFGGSGFLGRYIAEDLLARGYRLRFAERDPKKALYLKPLGNLGQTQFVAADVRRADTVSRAVAGADAVINLVGILNGDFDAVQRQGADTVARAAKAAGARMLVHMSAIGADPASPSAYGRSKGEGEQAVRAAFPEAVILRPSVVFGREDGFINRFAGLIRMLPVVPVISGGTRFQPVFVGDVAAAVAAVFGDHARHAGKTYELGGPEILSMMELNRWIADATGRKRHFVSVPHAAAKALARLGEWLPGAPITSDQLLMLARDNVVAAGADGLAQLGITPTPMSAVAPGWLDIYREKGRFADPRAD